MQTWIQDIRDESAREASKKAKLETAKRMLNSGLSLKDIAKYTGLPKKEIEKLATTH